MFEQDVAGLIKALRANKDDEGKVIQQALDETRKEIKSKDLEVKAAAILKLVYLEMLGTSIAFASFAIVECMSSVKYHIKAIGYLAASQCFDRETEVAVLVVNLVKKDLLSPPTPLFSSSPSSLTVAHLLSTLSAVSLLLTPSLARDLAPDLLSMLSHSRAPVRKQTMLVMWRVVRSWPEVMELGTGREEHGEDPWIERLRERLGDDDVGVVSATVNVICELARQDPRQYLSLAPELFGLLTDSTNNWMLIKIIKLFAVLTPLEPRLVRKLVPPLTELIETTPAMSLLYECIQTSIVGGMLNGREGEALAATCVDKLKGFLEDVDQNLRYIALVALVKILPTHPHLVAVHNETILTCVDDADMSIRMRALDLVEGMVDRRSLQPIVERLMVHLRPPRIQPRPSAAALLQAQQSGASLVQSAPVTLSMEYRVALILLVIRMCSANTYTNVSNFEWYLDTLVELAYFARTLQYEDAPAGLGVGESIKGQLIDVAARVKAIRAYAVRRMADVLGDETFLDHGVEVAEVLGAAAWICGEYCHELEDPRPVIASLLGSNSTKLLPPHILALYLHNGIKVYASWLAALSANWEEAHLAQIVSVTAALEERLASCASSANVELQERAAELGQLLELVRKGLDAPRPVAPADENTTDGFGSGATDPYEESRGFAAPEGSAGPALPPASLLLLSPAFSSHELNPVNSKAQGMVTLPAGLDLDMAIVARSRRDEPASEDEQVDDYGRPRGKGKAVAVDEGNEPRKKKGTKKAKGSRRNQVEDEAEMAKLQAERLERQRDDPYYVGTSSAPAATDEDIDAIPIVALALDEVPVPRRRAPTPPPVHIDVDGEMPDGFDDAPAPPPAVVVPAPTIEEPVVERQASEGAVLKVVKKKRKDPTKKKKSDAL